MQKIARCTIKLIANWRSSNDEKVAGERTKVLAKVAVKVSLKELALKIATLFTLTMDFD